VEVEAGREAEVYLSGGGDEATVERFFGGETFPSVGDEVGLEMFAECFDAAQAEVEQCAGGVDEEGGALMVIYVQPDITGQVDGVASVGCPGRVDIPGKSCEHRLFA